MQKVFRRIRTGLASLRDDRRTRNLARATVRAARPEVSQRPVVFFNASTRIRRNSQNAAFSLLASWAVRLSGAPVVHFVCRAGMSRCVLGTDESDPARPLPCGMCLRQSRADFAGANVRWFDYRRDEALAAALESLSLTELLRYEHPLPADGALKADSLPLGKLVSPSLRWRLRLNTLSDDEPTRFICREFILSAWNVAREFNALLDEVEPQAAVLFNGMHFPEATAAWLCRRRGVRVITHESGFQPFSGYFVEGDVTTYPISIPAAPLTPQQEARLDADLEKRYQGKFSMAGIAFWSEMHGLPEELLRKAAAHERVAAVFTNVIFDTTQLHANILFDDMFAWLDALLEIFRVHPETLFVIRAHPDEARPGKASRESVATWFQQKAAALPNLAFVPPQERISSYELIRLSRLVLTYNSTIGLESTLLGVPALGAAQAPFLDYDTVYFERGQKAYFRRLEALLAASRPEVPEQRRLNTRRFMYYRYYRFSLPFGEFLESFPPTGFVRLKDFSPEELAGSPTARALLGGLFHGKRFELDV